MFFPHTRLTCGMMTMAVLTYVMLREQCGNQDGTWGFRWFFQRAAMDSHRWDWGRWMKMVWWCVMYIFYYILRLSCWFFTAIVFMWKFSQNKVMWSRLIFRSKLPVEIPWWKCQKRAEKVYVPVYDHVTDDAIHLYLYLDHSIYIYKYDYMYMHAHVYRTISHFIVVVCRDMWLGPCIDRYH